LSDVIDDCAHFLMYLISMLLHSLAVCADSQYNRIVLHWRCRSLCVCVNFVIFLQFQNCLLLFMASKHSAFWYHVLELHC